ncbi:MAG: hypothetical protein ACAI44_18295 [Candidatus Sericytochromatia bacterium]
MTIYEIQLHIESINTQAALYEEANFTRRTEAIDDIEFKILDRIEGLGQTIRQSEELASLKQVAERLRYQLEQVDKRLMQRLREDIRSRGIGIQFKDWLQEYLGDHASAHRGQDEIGYDILDMFINGILLSHPLPTETQAREAEMVYYQQTPSRIILELVAQARLTRQDVFYDLGSGLGQVPILVHLLSGATAKGVEFEPAYRDYANTCVKDLNLSRIEFIQADARKADYSDGTVFFMYTPFKGSLLQDVLEKLWVESQKRRIKLFTYGPCTLQVSRQSWLKREDQNGDNPHKLGEFQSR